MRAEPEHAQHSDELEWVGMLGVHGGSPRGAVSAPALLELHTYCVQKREKYERSRRMMTLPRQGLERAVYQGRGLAEDQSLRPCGVTLCSSRVH